jgi:hypothetical protein
MTQRTAPLISTLVVVAAMVAGGALVAQEGEERLWEYNVEDDNGRAWANLTLTGLRMNEPFIPIVVGVQNNAKKPVTLKRDSFRLTDLDGLVYTLASVRDWRKHYDPIVQDRRMMSTGSIPWRVWYTSNKLGPTNFFPDLKTGRGNVLRDSVTLRRGYGMFDLMYFERPRNLAVQRPFFLEIWGKGWESPLRMRLLIN